MKKIDFMARWMLVFGTLGIFTFQALTYYGLANSNKVFAESIPANMELDTNANVVGFREKGPGGDLMTVCAITDHQLQMLQSAFETKVTTEIHNGKEITLATVSVPKQGSKKELREIIGKDAFRECRTAQTPRNFIYMFVVPGIS